MYRPRIIPVLLLNRNHLVKSYKFKDYTYIGDPINAVKIYNDLEADEIVFLDISATREKRLISLDFVKEVGEEANMPFAVGGGIRTLEDIQQVTAAGAEKVIIGAAAALDPSFIKAATDAFGSSTIAVCIDVKKNFWGKQRIYTHNGKKAHDYTPEDFAKLMEDNGAGEVVIQSIERDGCMQGYDIELVKKVSSAVKIPVIALGGAGSIAHMQELYKTTYVNGLAAGSLFVYQGVHRGVLINYPDYKVKSQIF
ncbi:MAG: AglZ/HisF2 family acetamidino modification protein, partial [Chitinophagales bacterium]|nr:AglZ/HisF2 family acetamidino modification protein [Chitinophagales bacterium]